jgi:hypothetical protein
MAGMSNISPEEHAAQLAEYLAKQVHSMGLNRYETDPEHYGWKWKVTVTRLERSDPLG